MYFKQLQLSLPSIDFEDNISHYLMSYGQKKLLTYYRLNEYARNEIINLIPTALHNNIGSIDYIVTGTEQSYIIPHTDNGDTVNINFYIETANAITVFYKTKSQGQPTPITDEKRTYGYLGGKVFQWNEVVFQTCFKANKNDCYLLNVKEPHSVVGLSIPDQRKFVTVMFDKIDFLSVLQHLT